MARPTTRHHACECHRRERRSPSRWPEGAAERAVRGRRTRGPDGPHRCARDRVLQRPRPGGDLRQVGTRGRGPRGPHLRGRRRSGSPRGGSECRPASRASAGALSSCPVAQVPARPSDRHTMLRQHDAGATGDTGLTGREAAVRLRLGCASPAASPRHHRAASTGISLSSPPRGGTVWAAGAELSPEHGPAAGHPSRDRHARGARWRPTSKATARTPASSMTTSRSAGTRTIGQRVQSAAQRSNRARTAAR